MERTMKKYIWFVVVSGLTLIVAPSWVRRSALSDLSAAQASVTQRADARVRADLEALAKTDLNSCSQRLPVIPQSNLRVFPQDRIEKTLNGIWRGRVSGEYPKPVLADDGFLNVDYYMIVDVKRSEALVLEQLSPKRAAPRPRPGAPTWSYLMCGRERYLPAHPAQIHEFQKVSDNLVDARAILESSTGLKFGDGEFVISAAWQKLVDQKYFDDYRYGAYAGGLFKPFQIGNVVRDGKSLFGMKMTAEYRGGGGTAARFESGVPLRGVESGEFAGFSARGGDYLVASLGNGTEVAKEASQTAGGDIINMFFDKVLIGPLVNGADRTTTNNNNN
jgi:hypothetical protein